MNIIEAMKVAKAQGKDVIELRYTDYVDQYASIVQGEWASEMLTAWCSHETQVMFVSRGQLLEISMLSDYWAPSDMKRQTLLDIERSVHRRARWGAAIQDKSANACG